MSGATPTGYSGKPLWQKLGLKPGLRVLARDPPGDYAERVGLPASDVALVGARAVFDLAHVFVTRAATLVQRLESSSRRLPPTGVTWVSWPKRTFGVDTDITEDTIRLHALPLGLVDVKVCAVDVTWSALKLVWRLKNR